MFDHNLRLQKPLEDFVELWERLSPRTVALLEGMLLPEAVFEDPYYRAQGSEKIEKLLQHRFVVHPNYKIKVHDFSWGRRQGLAFMHWSAEGMEAMSSINFMPGGKILSISEFWGAHEGFQIKAYKRLKI